MKRYLIFIGPRYYPQGGMGDFKAGFNNLYKAKVIFDSLMSKQIESDGKDYCWGYIYDMVDRKPLFQHNEE